MEKHNEDFRGGLMKLTRTKSPASPRSASSNPSSKDLSLN
jgi:hypothetical protein